MHSRRRLSVERSQFTLCDREGESASAEQSENLAGYALTASLEVGCGTCHTAKPVEPCGLGGRHGFQP